MVGSGNGSETVPGTTTNDATQNRSDAPNSNDTSSIRGSVKRLSKEFEESHPPEGFMAATSDVASSVVAEHGLLHRERRGSDITKEREALLPDGEDAVHPETRPSDAGSRPVGSSDDATLAGLAAESSAVNEHELTGAYPNGYHFPPKYPWPEATRQGLVAFWKFFKTPLGFFVTLYGLNVVAWGGMLFLLLCNAAPAMCTPDCNDINSPRRKWVEYDSQILNALFCVTGFGLIPWRFRDLYYLLQYRVGGKQEGLRRLLGIHRGWLRLPGSQNLRVDVGPNNIPDDISQDLVAIPTKSMPDAPLTGVRAPPTKMWKLDFVIWCMVWNTIVQGALSGCMWGLNRYNRPSWTTGFLVALACIIAMIGGLVMFWEGKNVKEIEGVLLTPQDKETLQRDRERGVLHYNNIKDKKPKEKVQDPEAQAGEKSGFTSRFRRHRDGEKR